MFSGWAFFFSGGVAKLRGNHMIVAGQVGSTIFLMPCGCLFLPWAGLGWRGDGDTAMPAGGIARPE